MLGNVCGLSEQSREVQRFTNCGRREVQVLLLDVSGLSLETVVPLATIDESLAGDDTHGRSRSQNIKKRRFPGTRHAHQGSESARFDPAVYMVQDASRFALDFDVVAYILPVEYSSLPLDDSGRLCV